MTEAIRKVTGGVLNTAFHNFYVTAGRTDTYGQLAREFKNLVGNSSFMLSEYALLSTKADFVEKLAGPNGYALARAYWVRRGVTTYKE